MSNTPVKRCGTVTTMTAPDIIFTLEVSMSDDLALIISLDSNAELLNEEVIELLVETIAHLEESK